MKSSRKLSLRRESLADLDLARVAGVVGASGVSCNGVTCASFVCSDLVECVPPSIVVGSCELPTRGC